MTACGGAAKDPSAASKAGKQAAKPAEVAEPESAESEPVGDAVHFDIEKDKSGILARTASTLDSTEAIGKDTPLYTHASALAHHAEAGTSNEKLCAHVVEVRGVQSDTDKSCVHTLEHQRVLLGPEVFAQYDACIMAASTEFALIACEAAEKEAERLLHVGKHGDGLDQAVCTAFFEHFEQLAMDDAGDQAEIVKEILEEVRDDVVAACQDQATKAEVECAMAATTMEALGACESGVL